MFDLFGFFALVYFIAEAIGYVLAGIFWVFIFAFKIMFFWVPGVWE